MLSTDNLVLTFNCISPILMDGRVLRPWPMSTHKNLGCSLCLGPYCRRPTWGWCPASARASPTVISKPRDEVTHKGNSPTSQEKSSQTQWRFGLLILWKTKLSYINFVLKKTVVDHLLCIFSLYIFFRYQISFYYLFKTNRQYYSFYDYNSCYELFCFS